MSRKMVPRINTLVYRISKYPQMYIYIYIQYMIRIFVDI